MNFEAPILPEDSESILNCEIMNRRAKSHVIV